MFKGAIYDVLIDLRPASSHIYWRGDFHLDEKIVLDGCFTWKKTIAHGFMTMERNSEFSSRETLLLHIKNDSY